MSDVAARIKKLLALTDSPNENEAAAAAAMATALMRKHGIELAEVQMAGGDEIRVDHETLHQTEVDLWRVTLASAVARSSGGRIVYANYYRKWSGTIEFYGPLGTVAAMADAYRYLEEQLFRLSSVALAARYGEPGGMRFRRSFLLGAVGRVSMRLSARNAVADDGAGQALVVLRTAVDRRVEDEHPLLGGPSYNPALDGDAYQQGQAAGNRVTLGDTELRAVRALK